MLLEGENENLGALHRAIHWCVNFLLSIMTHISTCRLSLNNTARAEACHRQASARAAKQARPKASLACNYDTDLNMIISAELFS